MEFLHNHHTITIAHLCERIWNTTNNYHNIIIGHLCERIWNITNNHHTITIAHLCERIWSPTNHHHIITIAHLWTHLKHHKQSSHHHSHTSRWMHLKHHNITQSTSHSCMHASETSPTIITISRITLLYIWGKTPETSQGTTNMDNNHNALTQDVLCIFIESHIMYTQKEAL